MKQSVFRVFVLLLSPFGKDNVARYAAPNPFLCHLYLNKICLKTSSDKTVLPESAKIGGDVAINVQDTADCYHLQSV